MREKHCIRLGLSKFSSRICQSPSERRQELREALRQIELIGCYFRATSLLQNQQVHAGMRGIVQMDVRPAFLYCCLLTLRSPAYGLSLRVHPIHISLVVMTLKYLIFCQFVLPASAAAMKAFQEQLPPNMFPGYAPFNYISHNRKRDSISSVGCIFQESTGNFCSPGDLCCWNFSADNYGGFCCGDSGRCCGSGCCNAGFVVYVTVLL